MPGAIDVHTHINEPGFTHWEGFETGTKASSLLGGITTLIDMPLNSTPATTNVEAFSKKLAAAKGKLFVDVGFHGGLVPENADSIEPILRSGVVALKAFMIDSASDDFRGVGEADFHKAMPAIAKSPLALLVHAELVGHAPKQTNGRAIAGALASRPDSMELNAIQMLIRPPGRQYNCRIHIVRLGTAEAIPDASRS